MVARIIPISPIDINPAGRALDKFKEAVKALDATDAKRMAGGLHTIASGMITLNLVLDRIIAARNDMKMGTTTAAE